MEEKPKKTLANIIDDSVPIAHALNMLSTHSREDNQNIFSEGGLLRDRAGFWEAIEPLIEAYRSFNNEAIIYAISHGLPNEEKKTRVKALIVKIIRNPEAFGLEEIKKSHIDYILEELYPDALAVFPTSSGQKNTWWEEIGLPIRQSHEREKRAFVDRVAEIKANNNGGIPDYGAKSWEQFQEMLRRIRALGDDRDLGEVQKILDEVRYVESTNPKSKKYSTKLKPEDRNGLNYRSYWTSMTEDEDPFR
jgi:hemerythrin